MEQNKLNKIVGQRQIIMQVKQNGISVFFNETGSANLSLMQVRFFRLYNGKNSSFFK